MSPGSLSRTVDRARHILRPFALTASFDHLSPAERKANADAQDRDDEGKFEEEADVKATLPGGGETAAEEATPPPPGDIDAIMDLLGPGVGPAQPLSWADVPPPLPPAEPEGGYEFIQPGDDLSDSWSHAYWVPVEVLARLEGNEGQIAGQVLRDPTDPMAQEMREKGIRKGSVLSVEYNPKDGSLKLGEGNHRLTAARAAGITHLPVSVSVFDLDPTLTKSDAIGVGSWWTEMGDRREANWFTEAEVAEILGFEPFRIEEPTPPPPVEEPTPDSIGNESLEIVRLWAERHGFQTAGYVEDGELKAFGRDAEGRVAFRITRSMMVPGWVYNDYFQMDEAHQGAGIASELDRELEDLYRARGVQGIQLEANIDVGAYSWARAGYGFDPDATPPIDMEEVVARAHRLLNREPHRSVPGLREEVEEFLDDFEERLGGDPDDWPSPLELAMYGSENPRPDGRGKSTWFGKELLTGNGAPSWDGIKYLEPEEATPPPPPEGEMVPVEDLQPGDVFDVDGEPYEFMDVFVDEGEAAILARPPGSDAFRTVRVPSGAEVERTGRVEPKPPKPPGATREAIAAGIAGVITDWAERHGFSVDVDTEDGFVSADGTDEDGNRAFRVQRQVYEDGRDVHHKIFELAPEHQKAGLGTELTQELEALYREMGVERVRLQANIDVGAYAWARAGFKFDSNYGYYQFLEGVNRRLEGLTRELGLSDEAVDEFMEFYYDFEDRLTSDNPDDWPSPLELAMYGSDDTWTDSEGRTMWLGKAILTSNDAPAWMGVKDLTAEEATPPPPSEAEGLGSEVRARFLMHGDWIEHEGANYFVDTAQVQDGRARITGRLNGEGPSGFVADLPGDQMVPLVDEMEANEPEPEPEPEVEADWRATYDEARAGLPENMSEFGMVPRTAETLAPTFQKALWTYRDAIDAFRAGKVTPQQARIIRNNGPQNLEFREHDEQVAMLEASYDEFVEKTRWMSNAELGDATMVPDVVIDAEGNEVPGPTAQAHLDALLATGKVLNDELERRIAARRVSEIEAPPEDVMEQAAAQRRELDNAHDNLVLLEMALTQEEGLARNAALDDAWRDMVLDEWSPHQGVRRFESVADVLAIASGAKRTTPKRKAAAIELRDRMAVIERDNLELAGQRRQIEYGRRRTARMQARYDQLAEVGAVPGTDTYGLFQRQESMRLIAELREVGGTAQVGLRQVPDEQFDQVTDSVQMAFDAFPTEWLADIDGMGIEVGLSNRGYFRTRRGRPPEITLSPDERAPAARPYRAVATHEFGHAVAEVRPHISRAEWAMNHRRSPRTDEEMILMMESDSGREWGYSDQWASTYTGRVYTDRATNQWEVFTTGLESLLTNSEYFDRLMEEHGYDAEFRAFILALMAEA